MMRVIRGWVDHFSMSLIGVNNLSRCRIYVMITLDGNIRVYQHFWSTDTKLLVEQLFMYIFTYKAKQNKTVVWSQQNTAAEHPQELTKNNEVTHP